jgi:hypothetical protein
MTPDTEWDNLVSVYGKDAVDRFVRDLWADAIREKSRRVSPQEREAMEAEQEPERWDGMS